MFKFLPYLAVVLAIFFGAFPCAGDDVLYWMVTDSTTVDGVDIKQFLDPSYQSTEDAWSAARVKMISPDGASSQILRIYWGNGYEEDGDWGVELMDSGNGYWGAENPVGVQSRTGYTTIGTAQGGSVSYSPEVMEIMFIMELGYNSWDDNVGDYVWQTLAQSETATYEELSGQHMFSAGNIAPSYIIPWSPDFYTIPEPNSFILLSIGTSMLLLSRKRA